MRLPKDTNCVCTQHAAMAKGKQTEHGRKSLQLPAWGCPLKDLLQGRAYYPHHPASMGWISPHGAQVWERTVAKVGMGSIASPYAWMHCQATPGSTNILRYSNEKGIEVGVTCTHRGTHSSHIFLLLKSWHHRLHGLWYSTWQAPSGCPHVPVIGGQLNKG